MDNLVATAITSRVSIHLNIMSMSVEGRGLSFAKGHRYGNVYLIIRTALPCLSRLSRHTGQSSVEVLPSNPDMEDNLFRRMHPWITLALSQYPSLGCLRLPLRAL